MKFETLEALKEYLTEQCFTDTAVFESPSYIDAIVGISTDGRLIYRRDLMVRHLCEHDGMTADAADAFIDSITMDAVNNMGEKAPIIMEDL